MQIQRPVAEVQRVGVGASRKPTVGERVRARREEERNEWSTELSRPERLVERPKGGEELRGGRDLGGVMGWTTRERLESSGPVETMAVAGRAAGVGASARGGERLRKESGGAISVGDPTVAAHG